MRCCSSLFSYPVAHKALWNCCIRKTYHPCCPFQLYSCPKPSPFPVHLKSWIGICSEKPGHKWEMLRELLPACCMQRICPLVRLPESFSSRAGYSATASWVKHGLGPSLPWFLLAEGIDPRICTALVEVWRKQVIEGILVGLLICGWTLGVY